MAEKQTQELTLQNKFYSDRQRKIMTALLMAVLAFLFISLFLLYMVTHPPQPQYFATSTNGRITPLTALDEPNQSDSAILQWANQASIACFSYNFVNYHEELLAASSYFTNEGWQQFMDALQQSNNLESVKSKKLIVSAVATRAPIILQKGVLNGSFSWRIQMPILVTYQSASEFTQQNNVVTMLITRISTLQSPRGIGISQFVVGSASGGLTS
jgi:intracellular multiplication protein IcmL